MSIRICFPLGTHVNGVNPAQYKFSVDANDRVIVVMPKSGRIDQNAEWFLENHLKPNPFDTVQSTQGKIVFWINSYLPREIKVNGRELSTISAAFRQKYGHIATEEFDFNAIKERELFQDSFCDKHAGTLVAVLALSILTQLAFLYRG